MDLARPPLAYDGRMAGRDVAHMVLEAETGVQRGRPPHVTVTRHLRHDRRGRDRGAPFVAVHHRPVRRRGGTEAKTVDEAGLGRRRQRGEHGAKPGEVRAVQPVSVDLARRNHTYGDLLGAADDRPEELLPPLAGDLLGVVQQRERPHTVVAEAAVVEQDTRDDERPRQRAASRLVGARDEACAEPAVEREQLLADRARHAPTVATASAGRATTLRRICVRA